MSALVSVKGARVTFGRGADAVKALDDVSIDIEAGEVLALVGESGSGKSTLLRAIAGLQPLAAGTVSFDGTPMDGKGWRAVRKRMQVVFQDPYASLNPRMKVVDIVTEPIAIHQPDVDRAARRTRASVLLDEVGMAEDALDRYPHEFSGGQRQRLGIARALSVAPELLLLDEPVSALDVSVQAQVLELLRTLREARGLTYLFVSHDLAVVRHVSDRIAVMQQGRLVEVGERDNVLDSPEHPYTRRLRDAAPVLDPVKQRARLRASLDESAS